ncbi:MAG: hypothetical protein ACO1OQ_16565 [Rufibacter sp.]
MGFTFEDGQVWVPYYECALFDDPCAMISARIGLPFAGQNGIDIKFSRREDKDKHSALSIYTRFENTISGPGEKIDSVIVSYLAENPVNAAVERIYGYPLPGSRFTITKFDRQNEIISGEFHLILRNQAGKTVTLSNGRFDFKFNACACDE